MLNLHFLQEVIVQREVHTKTLGYGGIGFCPDVRLHGTLKNPLEYFTKVAISDESRQIVMYLITLFEKNPQMELGYMIMPDILQDYVPCSGLFRRVNKTNHELQLLHLELEYQNDPTDARSSFINRFIREHSSLTKVEDEYREADLETLMVLESKKASEFELLTTEAYQIALQAMARLLLIYRDTGYIHVDAHSNNVLCKEHVTVSTPFPVIVLDYGTTWSAERVHLTDISTNDALLRMLLHFITVDFTRNNQPHSLFLLKQLFPDIRFLNT